MKFKNKFKLKPANARKWNHKKGGIIVAGNGIKLGNIFSKAQGFLNSDLGKSVINGIGNLYSGIKQGNELKKQEDQLKRDYNYISKQVNTLDIINQTNQLFQELQSQNPDIHYSEIDWRNLYGKNEGIAKLKALANARNYLANARLLQQNSESSGGGLDLSGLVNTGMLLLTGSKNKINTGTTNTTTTNTQIPSTATPTYFSSSFDWSKPTLTSAIKFST